MYENPLLANKKLQELYALMQRLRAASRREPALLGLEAVLAASLMQVEPGDFVSSLPTLTTAATLAVERAAGSTRGGSGGSTRSSPAPLPKGQRIAVATGIAQGLQLAKDSRLCLCFTLAGSPEQGWHEALTYATKARVPLIVICLDSTKGTRKTRETQKSVGSALTSEAILKLAAPIHLPVLSVDGTDAVAVYRVMQESVLRGRTLGGVAVIWCALPAVTSGTAKATGRIDPLTHMRGYLAERKLLPTKAGKPALSR